MRSRIVIPAAILVTAAYVKGRLDAHLLSEAERDAPIPVATPEDPIGRAQAEAADAIAVAEAQVAAAAAPPARRRPPNFAPHPFRPQVFARPAGESAPPADEWWVAGDPEAAPAAEPAAAEEPVAAPPVAEVPETDWVVGEWPAFESPWIAGPPRPPRAPDEAERAVLAEWLVTPAAAHAPEAAAEEDHAVLCEWIASVATTAAPEAEAADEAEPVVAEEPGPELEAEPVAEVVVDEDGRFSLGGWAVETGHMALCGVTFRDRRDAPVDASAIRLVPDATSNVAEGGLVLLADEGFAPDREGFTVLLAAAGPGGFAASGRYELIHSA